MRTLTEQESDGRWIAEIPQIPGAMSYGSTRDEAVARVEALGLGVLAEKSFGGTGVARTELAERVPSPK